MNTSLPGIPEIPWRETGDLREKGALILTCRVRSRCAVLHGAVPREIGVSAASATRTYAFALEDNQCPFESPLAACSRILLLFPNDWDVGVVESVSSERLDHVILERSALSHLNDIKVRFQEAEHELRAVITEQHVVLKNASRLRVELSAGRAQWNRLMLSLGTVWCSLRWISERNSWTAFPA